LDEIKLEDIKNNRNFCPLINGPCKEIALITDEEKGELEMKKIEFGNERPACYFYQPDDEVCEVKKFFEDGSYVMSSLARIILQTKGGDYAMADKIAKFLERNM